MKLDSGHDVTWLEEGELTEMRNHFGNYIDKGMVRLMPGRWLMPEKFLKFANKIYNFKMRQTDVIVETFPKCGTSWIQEIVWTMRNNPNLNNPEACKPNLRRTPFLE
ncbi:sulfotransferase 1C4-like [Palaemon carinicauda]|uniref:sulfotransferase 1C4-like n=1 Tax=Palaemon carinicauda TaxID=392227 RepID=UPI0035B5E7F2